MTTPAGKALFGMMGVFAEFERVILAERVRVGVAERRRLIRLRGGAGSLSNRRDRRPGGPLLRLSWRV
jgi:DNA invertase Pin-like site-specific DNA recombinase